MSKLFHFKEFSLSDSECAMKIGTDGVLLGSYAARIPAENILDIGTGSGLLALMIAQKTGKLIDAIEVEPNAAQQASENFQNSPWSNKLRIFNIALQQFCPPDGMQYDLVVCNPPFFENSLPNPEPARARARHNHSLNLADLFLYAAHLMKKNGTLVFIYTTGFEKETDILANRHNLWVNQRMYISPNQSKPAKRMISVLTKQEIPTKIKSEHLAIETETRHIFTEEYKKLTSDYHPFL